MSSTRIQYLDGLRGVACLMVVAGHYMDALSPSSVVRPFDDGVLAVAIFFVISGFILTDSFAVNIPAQRHLAGRLVRLLVPCAVALFLAYAASSGLHYLNPDFPYFSIKTAAVHVFGSTGVTLLDPPTWTIGYEIYGSCAVLVLVLIRARSQYVWMAVCAALIIVFGVREIGLFVIGHLMRVNWDKITRSSRTIRFSIVVLAAYFLLTECLNGSVFGGSFGTIGTGLIHTDTPLDAPHAMLGALLFLAIGASASLQAFFSHKAPDYIGKLSFSIYLIHWPIMFLLHCASSWPVTIIAGVAMTLMLSILFERYVDKPSISLNRRIKKVRLSGRVLSFSAPTGAAE